MWFQDIIQGRAEQYWKITDWTRNYVVRYLCVLISHVFAFKHFLMEKGTTFCKKRTSLYNYIAIKKHRQLIS